MDRGWKSKTSGIGGGRTGERHPSPWAAPPGAFPRANEAGGCARTWEREDVCSQGGVHDMVLARDSSSGDWLLEDKADILFLVALSLPGCSSLIEALDQAIPEPPPALLFALLDCVSRVVFPQQRSRSTVALTLDLSSPIAAARGSTQAVGWEEGGRKARIRCSCLGLCWVEGCTLQAFSWKAEKFWWVLNCLCSGQWKLVTPESPFQKENHIRTPRGLNFLSCHQSSEQLIKAPCVVLNAQSYGLS